MEEIPPSGCATALEFPFSPRSSPCAGTSWGLSFPGVSIIVMSEQRLLYQLHDSPYELLGSPPSLTDQLIVRLKAHRCPEPIRCLFHIPHSSQTSLAIKPLHQPPRVAPN